MTFYKFTVGLVLTVAMIAVLGFGALVFSARDFQYGVADISSSTRGVIDFSQLAKAETQVAAILEETKGPRGEHAQIQEQLSALDGEAQQAAANANTARAGMVGAIAAIEQRARVQSAASAAADLSTQGLTQRVNALASRSGLAPDDQQSLATLRTQAEQLSVSDERVAEANEARAALVTRRDLVGGQVEESNRRIQAAQRAVLAETDQYERIRSEANALRNLSPLGLSAYLAQGHPALLSTMLVLLMGALGSLLYLFPAYLNRPQPVTMAEIAVRLIFGMCAALAVYVLANAAVSSFSFGSGPAQAGTSSNLNPFTVSLFGIVAGVLSEDIAKWIQDRGRGIFTQEPGGVSNGADLQPASSSMINPHGGPGAP
ncbi:MAG: hypothetical protein ABL883_05350 [Terricaulis sp.]